MVLGKQENTNGIEMGTIRHGFRAEERSPMSKLGRSRSQNVVTQATDASFRMASPNQSRYGQRVNRSHHQNGEKPSRFDKFPSMHCLNRQTSSRSNDRLVPNNLTVTNSSTATYPASGPSSPHMGKKNYLVVHHVNNSRQQIALNLLEDHDLDLQDGFNRSQVCV